MPNNERQYLAPLPCDQQSRHPTGVQSSGDRLRFESRVHAAGFRKSRVGGWVMTTNHMAFLSR
jgi:hypothetical protein